MITVMSYFHCRPRRKKAEISKKMDEGEQVEEKTGGFYCFGREKCLEKRGVAVEMPRINCGYPWNGCGNTVEVLRSKEIWKSWGK